MTTVRHDVTFQIQVLASHAPMFGRLEFDAADPFAVAMVFRGSGGDNRWVVARSLLAGALIRPVGDDGGDIHARPDMLDGVSSVRFTLSSPQDGVGRAWLSSAVLRRFLAATYGVVPSGEEAVDLDALIAQLLNRTEDIR